MNQEPPQATELPDVHVPTGSANGWRWTGFALVICGLAGLLFHMNEEVPVLQSDLGRISIGLIVVGILLCLVSIVTRTASHRRRTNEDA